MPQRPYVIDELISAKAIAARIEQLSRAIKTEYKDTDKLVVVGLSARFFCLYRRSRARA